MTEITHTETLSEENRALIESLGMSAGRAPDAAQLNEIMNAARQDQAAKTSDRDGVSTSATNSLPGGSVTDGPGASPPGGEPPAHHVGDVNDMIAPGGEVEPVQKLHELAAPGGEQEALDWRPEVCAFADLMEQKLQANDHKGGWRGDAPWPLFLRLKEEVRELADLLGPGTRGDFASWAYRVGREAADVANFAMMIADVCGALDGFQPQALYATPQPPESGWRTIPDTDDVVRYVSRWGGSCRDCADNDDICPRDGLPCGIGARHVAIRNVIKALNYGYSHGYLSPPPQLPEGAK